MLQELGEPVRFAVKTQDGGASTDASAPQYLARPLDWSNMTPNLMTDEACIIGLEGSCAPAASPRDLGIPETYRPPELLFGSTVGIGCDLWALGCTLFESRTGKNLVNIMVSDIEEIL